MSSVLPRSRSFLSAATRRRVVARVEADRRLVEHVQHAAQAAADLAGQANALRFAAGERRRGAAEREVIEADVDQEREPVFDLADQFAGDLLLVRPRASTSSLARASSPSGVRPIWSSVRSRNRTAAASSRSRLPPHSLQSISPTNCSSSARSRGESFEASSSAG